MRYSNVTEKEQKLFEDLSYEQRMILVSRYTSRLKASSEAMAALGRPDMVCPMDSMTRYLQKKAASVASALVSVHVLARAAELIETSNATATNLRAWVTLH
jgi:hypothetical protein